MPSRYKGLSDNKLVGMVRENDFQAFSELGERYLWLIQTKADRFEQVTAPEWEDLCQEGYMGLFVAANTYEAEYKASFKTYAGICIYNRMVSAARRYANKKNQPLNTSVSLDSDNIVVGTAESPEDVFEGKEDYQRVLKKIDLMLSPLEQRVLTLYLSGAKRTGIEERTGISLKTFDNAMHRVRKKLKDHQ